MKHDDDKSDPKIFFESNKNPSKGPERRKLDRITFNNFIGIKACMRSKNKLYIFELCNLSIGGCLLSISKEIWDAREKEVGKSFDLLLFFSENTYLKINLDVRRVYVTAMNFVELGCEFNRASKSYQAMKIFIDFLFEYSTRCEEYVFLP